MKTPRFTPLSLAAKAVLAATLLVAAFDCNSVRPEVTCISGPCGEETGGTPFHSPGSGGADGANPPKVCDRGLVVRYLEEGCPGAPVCVSGTGGACQSGKVACGCDGVVYLTDCGGESRAPFSHYLSAEVAQAGDACQPAGGGGAGGGGVGGHGE